MAPSTREKRVNSQNPQFKTTLDPILENETAQAVHLQHFYLPKGSQEKVTTSRRSIVTNISDPDNGILFLDNFEVLKNP
jgi:hypothetical protein